MEKIELEVYSQSTNQAIVKMPDRHYPGIVIQGDTLAGLSGLAESVFKRVQLLDDEELEGDAEELRDMLRDFLFHYKVVMNQHNINFI